jgi:hypothetical protein
MMVISAFAGGLLAAPHLAGWAQSPSTVQAAPALAGEAVVMAYGEVLAQVYEKVLPSVVRVEVIGHPAPEVLERYTEHGLTILRTDQQGTIELTTDGERLWVEAAR